MTTNYPLSWPQGWKRTAAEDRVRAKFGKSETKYSSANPGYSWKEKKDLSIAQALQRLFIQLDRLDAAEVIVSTNVETRLDGTPRSDRRAPSDPGVAVYFKIAGKPRVLAVDKWDRVADNIAALAAHIDAIRCQERYGVGTLEQAFAGYMALAAPASSQAWWKVLNFNEKPTLERAEAAYKQLAMKAHPDNGGSHEEMSKINAAIAEARKENS